jgi:predicted TIM-barrel fold metal-dependent hydrolase
MQKHWQHFNARRLMKQPVVILIAVLMLALSTGFTQVRHTTIPLDDLKMQPSNVKTEWVTYKGRKALRVTDIAPASVGGVDRLIILSKTEFQDGVIEIELTGEPGPNAGEGARGFVGVAFRVVPETASADHHQHLFSPTITELLPSVKPITAQDVIGLLDAAGIQRGLILSTAYMYGRPGREPQGEYAKVRAENDWVGAQAALFPERLRAFCSFNPLKEYALDELARCAKDPHLRRGIKLHFGNSDVQLENPEHLEKLKSIFREANSQRMAIVAHLRASISKKRPYGPEQARAFLDQLLPLVPDIPVQIAHLAASGPGYISESMARKYWPNETPVGKRIGFDQQQAQWAEVVGVISDVHHFGLSADARPTFYFSSRQHPRGAMTLVVRASGDPASDIAAVRREVEALDKNLAITSAQTMERLVADSLSTPRFVLALIGSFATVALLLAGLGIYGVMTYSVAQRTQEIGIRIALGAQARNVLELVVGQGMKLALLGLVIGLAASFGLTRLMSKLLFGISPTDLVTFVGIALLLVLVALVACWIPARRATKVDPMIALRVE